MSSKLFQGVFEISGRRRITRGPIKKLPVYTLANKLSHVTNEITFFQCALELRDEGMQG